MKQRLLDEMQRISPEEQEYLNGNAKVKRDIYTAGNPFQIERERFLQGGRLITVRPHSRFIEFPEHGHNYIEMMYVCKGSITHIIQGKTLVMQKGDFLLLNQHVRHAVKRAELSDLGINFIALPEFFDIPLGMLQETNVLAEFIVSILQQKNQTPGYLLFSLGEDSAVENLMENMISSMLYGEQQEEVIRQYSMGLVFLYLLKRMDSLTETSPQGYQEVLMKAVRECINVNYQTITLGKIAEDFHQSLSALSKLIKQKTGCNFQELLQRKRFQKATELLLGTELSVEEVVITVGYENQSYFYRQFKKRYAMTPRQYREKNRKGCLETGKDWKG